MNRLNCFSKSFEYCRCFYVGSFFTTFLECHSISLNRYQYELTGCSWCVTPWRCLCWHLLGRSRHWRIDDIWNESRRYTSWIKKVFLPLFFAFNLPLLLVHASTKVKLGISFRFVLFAFAVWSLLIKFVRFHFSSFAFNRMFLSVIFFSGISRHCNRCCLPPDCTHNSKYWRIKHYDKIIHIYRSDVVVASQPTEDFRCR